MRRSSLEALATFALVVGTGCSTAVGGAVGPAASVNLTTEEANGAGALNLYLGLGDTGRTGTRLPTDPELVEGFGEAPSETWSLFYAARIRASDTWFHFSFGPGIEVALNNEPVGLVGRVGLALISVDALPSGLWGGAFGPFVDIELTIPLWSERRSFIEPGLVLRPYRLDRRTLALTIGGSLEILHRFDTDSAVGFVALIGLRWVEENLLYQL